MRVLTKESFSQSRCAEVDLRFRAVAQRLIIEEYVSDGGIE